MNFNAPYPQVSEIALLFHPFLVHIFSYRFLLNGSNLCFPPRPCLLITYYNIGTETASVVKEQEGKGGLVLMSGRRGELDIWLLLFSNSALGGRVQPHPLAVYP